MPKYTIIKLIVLIHYITFLSTLKGNLTKKHEIRSNPPTQQITRLLPPFPISTQPYLYIYILRYIFSRRDSRSLYFMKEQNPTFFMLLLIAPSTITIAIVVALFLSYINAIGKIKLNLPLLPLRARKSDNY